MSQLGKNIIDELRKLKCTEIEMQVIDYFRKSVQNFRRKKKQFAWNPEGEGRQLYYWIYSYAIANYFGISDSFAKYVMNNICKKGILKKKLKKSCGLIYYQKTDLYYKIFREYEKSFTEKTLDYSGIILDASPSLELRKRIQADKSRKKTILYGVFDYEQVKRMESVKLRDLNLYKELKKKIERMDFQQNAFNYKGNMFFMILPVNLCKSLGIENNRANRKKLNRMLINLEKEGFLKTLHVCYFKEAGIIKIVNGVPNYKQFDTYETFDVIPNEQQLEWLETYKNLNLICLSYKENLAQEWNNPSLTMEQPQLKNGTHSYRIESVQTGKFSITVPAERKIIDIHTIKGTKPKAEDLNSLYDSPTPTAFSPLPQKKEEAG